MVRHLAMLKTDELWVKLWFRDNLVKKSLRLYPEDLHYVTMIRKEYVGGAFPLYEFIFESDTFPAYEMGKEPPQLEMKNHKDGVLLYVEVKDGTTANKTNDITL